MRRLQRLNDLLGGEVMTEAVGMLVPPVPRAGDIVPEPTVGVNGGDVAGGKDPLDVLG